ADVGGKSVVVGDIAGKAGGDPAIAAKGRIEGAIGIEPSQLEGRPIEGRRGSRGAGDQDLAIGLHREGIDVADAAMQGKGREAVVAEGAIGRAVGMDASNDGMIAIRAGAITGSEDFTIGLDDDLAKRGGCAALKFEYLAATAESRVERAAAGGITGFER